MFELDEVEGKWLETSLAREIFKSSFANSFMQREVESEFFDETIYS